MYRITQLCICKILHVQTCSTWQYYFVSFLYFISTTKKKHIIQLACLLMSVLVLCIVIVDNVNVTVQIIGLVLNAHKVSFERRFYVMLNIILLFIPPWINFTISIFTIRWLLCLRPIWFLYYKYVYFYKHKLNSLIWLNN